MSACLRAKYLYTVKEAMLSFCCFQILLLRLNSPENACYDFV